jgi:hypothetical protein
MAGTWTSATMAGIGPTMGLKWATWAKYIPLWAFFFQQIFFFVFVFFFCQRRSGGARQWWVTDLAK